MTGLLQTQFGLGENIVRQRKKQGLTQTALGAILGVSAQAVSKWERQLACPDIMLLPRLAAVLGVTLDELFAPCFPTVDSNNNRAVS